MLATILGRLAGFIRETVIAAKFGATASTDAYLVANVIPSIVFVLVTHTISALFIPICTGYIINKEEKEAWKATYTLGILIAMGLIIFSALSTIFAPAIVKVLAPGFNAESSLLAISLTRIIIWSIVFTGVAGLISAVLNSYQHFLSPALVPLMSSVFIIVGTIMYADKLDIFVLPYAVLVGAIATIILQLPFLLKRMPKIGFVFDVKHPGVVDFGKLLIPVLIGVSIGQVNVIVDRIFASSLHEGVISALHYADKLIQLPVGLFGVALATAIFPTLSAYAAKRNFDEVRQTFASGIKLITLVVVPATIGLIVLSTPIIRLLFERGEFGPKATYDTSVALIYYALGIGPAAWQLIISRTYYSMKDTKTVAIVGACMIVLNIIADWVFIKLFGHGGLALATSFVATVYALILAVKLSKRLGGLGISDSKEVLFKIFAASGIMAVVTYFSYLQLIQVINQLESIGKLLVVVVPIIIGTAVYSILILLFKIPEVEYLVNLVKKRIFKSKG